MCWHACCHACVLVLIAIRTYKSTRSASAFLVPRVWRVPLSAWTGPVGPNSPSQTRKTLVTRDIRTTSSDSDLSEAIESYQAENDAFKDFFISVFELRPSV